jgi:primosomal protein N'
VAKCDNCGAPVRFDRNKGILACDHCGGQREAPAIVEQLDAG